MIKDIDELVVFLREKGIEFYITDEGRIRTREKARECPDGMCPLVAACFHMTGYHYYNPDYWRASIRLGISDPNSVHLIAHAADGRYLRVNGVMEIRTKLLSLVPSPMKEEGQ